MHAQYNVIWLFSECLRLHKKLLIKRFYCASTLSVEFCITCKFTKLILCIVAISLLSLWLVAHLNLWLCGYDCNWTCKILCVLHFCISRSGSARQLRQQLWCYSSARCHQPRRQGRVWRANQKRCWCLRSSTERVIMKSKKKFLIFSSLIFQSTVTIFHNLI